METLAIIGLTGNAIQLVDFGGKLIAKSAELYRSNEGALAENIDVETAANHLLLLNNKLKDAATTTGDNELKRLCESCKSTADDLLVALNKVKVNGKQDRWKSIRKALRSVWSKEKIRELEGRLARFREELNLHIIVGLREQNSQLESDQLDRFRDLDSLIRTGFRAIVNKHSASEAMHNTQIRLMEKLCSEIVSRKNNQNAITREKLIPIVSQMSDEQKNSLKEMMDEVRLNTNILSKFNSKFHLTETQTLCSSKPHVDRNNLTNHFDRSRDWQETQDSDINFTASNTTPTLSPAERREDERMSGLSLQLSLESNHGADDIVGGLLRSIAIHPILPHELIPTVRQREIQDKDDSQAKHRFRGSTKRTKSVAADHDHSIIRPQPFLHRLSISDYRQASSACEAGCICKCHAPRHFRILRHSYLFGSLSITISASSGNKSLCTETSCSRRSMSVARATYRFPIWFLARILCLTVSVQNGLNTSLKTPRVVPDNADIMHFAKVGDLDKVRSLIEQRLASPLDVNATWNVPVLSYAVQGHHTELCRLLLNEGADPCVENRSNISALDRAWDIVLTQSADTQTEDKLRSIFSLQYDSIWFEEQQFTTLHKIIFRSIGRDMRAELQLSTSAINQKDSKGRTPLAWASARGEEQFVRTLLEFGADPNITCATGNSPLSRSVRARSSKCIRLLLEHGADIRLKNSLGFTALHYAAYYKDDEAYLTPLLDFGFPINEKDDYGWTALAATAEYDHVRSATALLHRGADVETRDKNGWTPLLRAVNSNSHGVLELLLGRGADHRAVSFRNETILYFAASRGDYKTLEILTRAALEGLDPNTKDDKGQRATDMIELRSPQPSQLVAAFDSLIESLR